VGKVNDRPLLIFDGDCGFCTASARWISSRWTRPALAVPWQALGEERLHDLGLSGEDVRGAAYWISRRGRASRGHRAVGHSLLAAAGWHRALGAALLLPPVSWLARPGYWLVARYRHRLPGATPACQPESGPPPRTIS